MDMLGYPDRVTRQEDGSYRWVGRIDLKYHQKQTMIGMKACLGIGAFIFVLYLCLTIRYQDWKGLLIATVCILIFLGISAFFTRLFGWGIGKAKPDPHERYEMTDEHMKTGTGKPSAYFPFRKAKVLILAESYFELQSEHRKMRIFFPPEDRDFIRGYIQGRIPPETELRYE